MTDILKHSDLSFHKVYKIKCGWGLTKAKLIYIKIVNGKYRYFWKAIDNGFEFCSNDLEDIVEVRKYVRKAKV